jgi:type VI secretion system protein ImpB
VAKKSSQKFIQKNRAPRVQIEYDVEVYGAEKKVQIPFVMGVMADLAGNPTEAPAPVDERKLLEIDVDNFDNRLKAQKPRVAFAVPNTLTGDGNLSVDITFESMDDFSPAAVARKVGSLNKLLQARTQLSNLITYMDGKSGAEDLIAKALDDPAILQSLVSAPKDGGDSDAESEE